jgi:hypothetical protein
LRHATPNIVLNQLVAFRLSFFHLQKGSGFFSFGAKGSKKTESECVLEIYSVSGTT